MVDRFAELSKGRLHFGMAGNGNPVVRALAVNNADQIAATPEPPYVAVIFTSLRTEGDAGYAETAMIMNDLAAGQPGYLGIESARGSNGLGITVSYWQDEGAARDWKLVAEHLLAQRQGRESWYREYRVRVAVVSRDYGFVQLQRRGARRAPNQD